MVELACFADKRLREDSARLPCVTCAQVQTVRVLVLRLLGCPEALVAAATGVAGFCFRVVGRTTFIVLTGHGYKKCPFRGLSVVEVVVQPVAVVGFTGIRVIVRIVLVLLLHPSQAKRIRVRTH